MAGLALRIFLAMDPRKSSLLIGVGTQASQPSQGGTPHFFYCVEKLLQAGIVVYATTAYCIELYGHQEQYMLGDYLNLKGKHRTTSHYCQELHIRKHSR